MLQSHVIRIEHSILISYFSKKLFIRQVGSKLLLTDFTVSWRPSWSWLR